MASTTPGYDAYARAEAARRAAREAAFARDEEAVLAAMAAAGLALVEVDFDGSGDEGAIQDVRAFAAAGGDATAIPDVAVALAATPHGGDSGDGRTTGLAEAVEDLAWAALGLRCGGWEDGDGAWGQVAFDAAARTVTLDHNHRVVESVNSSFEL